MLYFLLSTLVLTLYIDVVLSLSIRHWWSTPITSALGLRAWHSPLMAEPWQKWKLMALCLMWRPSFATLVICWAPVEAVTAWSRPGAVWLGESSGNFCLSWPPDTSHQRSMAMCLKPVFAQLCSMVVKHRDPKTRNYNSFATVIHWICGVKHSDDLFSDSLLKKLDIKDIEMFGYNDDDDDEVSHCRILS